MKVKDFDIKKDDEARLLLWVSQVLLYDEALDGNVPKSWVMALAEGVYWDTSKRGPIREVAWLLVERGLTEALETAWRLGGREAAATMIAGLWGDAHDRYRNTRVVFGRVVGTSTKRVQRVGRSR